MCQGKISIKETISNVEYLQMTLFISFLKRPEHIFYMLLFHYLNFTEYEKLVFLENCVYAWKVLYQWNASKSLHFPNFLFPSKMWHSRKYSKYKYSKYSRSFIPISVNVAGAFIPISVNVAAALFQYR